MGSGPSSKIFISGYRFPLKNWYGAPSRSNWALRVQLLLEDGPYDPSVKYVDN